MFRTLLSPTLFCVCTMRLHGGLPNSDQPHANDPATQLSTLLESYFQSDDPHERANIATRIKTLPDITVDSVAAALLDLDVWSPTDADELHILADPAENAAIDITIKLPPDYNSAKRWPLILVIANHLSGNPDPDIATCLGPLRHAFILAFPHDTSCLDFHAPLASADQPRDWLRAIRRRVRIDSDRVFLVSQGTAGDRALNLATMHADIFAAALLLETRLDAPYAREMQQLLFPNLRNLPIRLVWTEPELPPNTVLKGRPIEVAFASLHAMKLAQTENLPFTQTVRRDGESFDLAAFWERKAPADEPLSEPRPSGSGVGGPPLQRWGTRMADAGNGRGTDTDPIPTRRTPTHVTHRFRYPAQSRAGFVRADQLTPPIWQGDQIDIVSHPHVDDSTFIRGVLESKLAHLEARIEGQSITVTAAKCDTVELHLSPAHLDFAQPVQITYNGKRRFDGRLSPDISTLLDSAYKDWEFQHPAPCRLRLSDRGRVLPF